MLLCPPLPSCLSSVKQDSKTGAHGAGCSSPLQASMSVLDLGQLALWILREGERTNTRQGPAFWGEVASVSANRDGW